MELFIQIREGQPYEHPIFADNFRQAFPNIDPSNLPESFAQFVRVERPALGVYEVYEGVSYEWDGAVVTDVHHTRPMTSEETIAKQEIVKAAWAQSGYASWVFDEVTCSFVAPVPHPQDGKSYRWNESTTSWVEIAA